MKNKKRLTLDSFKEKAESVATNDILEKVQGGDWSDCHNCSSTWEKIKSYARAAANLVDHTDPKG